MGERCSAKFGLSRPLEVGETNARVAAYAFTAETRLAVENLDPNNTTEVVLDVLCNRDYSQDKGLCALATLRAFGLPTNAQNGACIEESI